MADIFASNANAATQSHSRYATLDGLRGIAACLVVVYHIHLISPTLKDLAPHGYLAVDLFFALSGFVLSFVYDDRIANGLTISEFMRIRIIRLAPVYWIGWCIGFFSLFLISGQRLVTNLVGAAFNLVMIPFILPQYSLPQSPIFIVNPPFWSLFFELLVANAFFVVFHSQIGTKTLLLLCATSLGMLLYVTYVFHHTVNVGPSYANFVGGFPRVFYSFFAGVAVRRLANRFQLPVIHSPLILLACAAFLMMPVYGRAGTVYDLVCVAVVFPALIMLGANAKEVRPELGILLGNSSYALYAIHWPILMVFSLHVNAMGNAETLAYAVAMLAGLFGIAYVIAVYIDPHMRKTLARFTGLNPSPRPLRVRY